MFDDQPVGAPPAAAGQPPANLPIGEPEDIFDSGESADPAAVPESDDTVSPVSSALGAGVLTPKTAPPLPPPRPLASPPPPPLDLGSRPPVPPRGSLGAPPAVPPASSETVPDAMGGYAMKRPSFIKELLIAIVVIAGVVLLAGAVWTVYRRLRGSPARPSPLPSLTAAPEPVAPDTTVPAPATTSGRGSVDEKVLFGDSIDSDNDGLTDEEERRLGTDPHNWDTDGDGLSDGDEAHIWHTNPLNPDTDGDGYPDGVEVKNGFNPNGPGKIFGAVSSTPR